MGKDSLKIIYEDEHLIVVEKPSGMLSVKTSGGVRRTRGNTVREEVTAHSLLNDYIRRSHRGRDARVYIVHRLDRDTSGLMVFAKSEEIKHLLQENWDNAVTRRGYVAVSNWDSRNAPEGTIKSWLKENRAFLVYSSPRDNGGQLAITDYKVIGSNPKIRKALVELELHTGRKNQIRVHLQEIGSPIYGDRKYYGENPNVLAENKKARRLYLHAHTLNFIHPVSGKEMKFSTGIPREFKNVISCSQQPY